MANSGKPLRSDEPAAYRVTVQGCVGERWAQWFEDMRVTTQSSGASGYVSVLCGTVADQAALLGLLQWLYTLGLPLLEVKRKET